MISTEIRDKFKKLYQEKFDIALSDEEATKMATDLVILVQVLVKPDTPLATEDKPLVERRKGATISLQPYQ